MLRNWQVWTSTLVPCLCSRVYAVMHNHATSGEGSLLPHLPLLQLISDRLVYLHASLSLAWLGCVPVIYGLSYIFLV